MSPHAARLAVELLAGFIAGLGIATGLGRAFRDRIKAAMLRRRGRRR